MSVYKTDSEIPALWQVGDVMLDEIEVKAKLGDGHLGARDLVYHRGFKVELAVTSVDPAVFAGQTPDFMGQVRSTPHGARWGWSGVRRWVQLGLHPHVVTCHYVREMGGVPRIFAEYVADGSLADWIGERTLYEGGHEAALERMLDVAIQVAWGLSYAHEMGVYHQNVTPENVMLMAGEPNSNPIAKLTDFGTPKAVSSDIYGWGLSVLQMFLGENEWLPGVIPADMLADVVKNGAQCADADIIPPIPTALADLLRDCAALASELADETAKKKAMGSVADQVIAIYEQEMGQPYARKQPEPITGMPARHTSCADNLNNRAVSLAEQGEIEEAMRLWQAAIHESPLHIEARYNLGVARWRRAELSDETLVLRLQDLCHSFPDQWRPKYLLAQVHLERWDRESAIMWLEDAYKIAPHEAQIQAALNRARSDDYPTIRCVRTLGRHRSDVLSVALSADGSLGLSGSADQTLKVWRAGMPVWDIASGRCLRTLSGHTESVNSVALSADGSLGLSGSDDQTVKVWDLTLGRCLRTLDEHTESVNSVAFADDGRRMLSGSNDGTVKVWDLTDGRCLHTFKNGASVHSVAVAGSFVLCGLSDGTLKMWHLADGSLLNTLSGHTASVRSVTFFANGRLALSGSQDTTVKVWDLTNGRCLRTLEGHTKWVLSVAVVTGADGFLALSGSPDQTLKVWDLANGRCLRTVSEHTSWVLSVALVTGVDGSLALSGSRDKTLKVWALPNERMAASDWQLASLWSVERWAKKLIAQRAWRQACEEHLRQKHFVTALTLLQQARKESQWTWNRANIEAWWSLYPISRKKRLRAAWLTYTFEGHKDCVNAIAIAADGTLALSGSRNNTLKVWDLDSGRCLRTLEGHTGGVNSVALSANGRLGLSGSYDRTVKVWDLASGHCLRTLNEHWYWINSVAFSPDNRWVLSGPHGSHMTTGRLWDLASGHSLRTIDVKYSVGSAVFFPDGRRALSGSSDGKLKVWNLTRQRCQRVLNGYTNGINSVAIAADGTLALSSSEWDKTLKVWDLATGRKLNTLEGHTRDVRSVALSADNRWALSCSTLEVKVWDLASGECVLTLKDFALNFKVLALSGDGRWAITGSWDGTIKVWALDWELETFDEADWDEGARVYLVNFLTLHTPFVGQLPLDREPTKKERQQALTRRGKPTWNEEDFQGLIRQLQHAGYGWLRPEGVRAELMQMAKTWKKPPKL